MKGDMLSGGPIANGFGIEGVMLWCASESCESPVGSEERLRKSILKHLMSSTYTLDTQFLAGFFFICRLWGQFDSQKVCVVGFSEKSQGEIRNTYLPGSAQLHQND